jgi:hypothetical protein
MSGSETRFEPNRLLVNTLSCLPSTLPERRLVVEKRRWQSKVVVIPRHFAT